MKQLLLILSLVSSISLLNSCSSLNRASKKDPISSYYRYFRWQYNSETFSVRVLLTRALNSQYSQINQKRPKLTDHEDFLGYLHKLPGDTAIPDIARQLRLIAKDKKFNDKQLAELAVSFVQGSTKYDTEQAEAVEEASEAKQRLPYKTPYQVLWEGKGICMDKSLLGYDLLKELGFGTALLFMPSNEHVGFGIMCQRQFGLSNNNYLFIESTNYHKIGSYPTELAGKEVQKISIELPVNGKKYW